MVAKSVWAKITDPSHTFIIAEAGVNHNGRLDLAKKLVDQAVRAGADAVKFQAFKAERLASAIAPKAAYQKKTTGIKESQLEMLQKLELSPERHAILKEYCRRKGILFLSSPFDEESADELDEIGVPLFKIPSGEITNLPFLSHIARKNKPVILSTGMSEMHEIQTAIRKIRSSGNESIALLHCISNYPASPDDINLRAMETMRRKFKLPVGFSDHSEGIEIALAAAALGAVIIEKHFTLDRSMEGPDHRASLDPRGLSDLVSGIRRVERSLGSGIKKPALSESDTAKVARKSLIAACPIEAGTVLTKDMITLRRPGTGLPAEKIPILIGRKLKRSLAEGELFSLSLIAKKESLCGQ